MTVMSLLFVDTERVWRGGQDQLLTLLGGLADRGHRVHLVCHPGTLLEERARKVHAVVHPLAMHSEIGLVFFFRLLQVLARTRPDIVAFNTPRPVLLGGLASRIRGTRARIIFRRVNFPLRKNWGTRLKYSWGIDCIVAISRSIGQQLQAGGVPASRIATIYEGMDLEQFPFPRPPRPSGRRRVVIGTIAHLSPEKGLHYLVEAASRIPGVAERMQFVIVGDGACRQELETQVRDRGLENSFEFTGFQERPQERLNSFDVFLLPSISEGLSSAILTAMASSLPVIATRVGGIPELIVDEENGLLVPPADPAALAAAIERLAGDPEEAARMGRAGRRRVEAGFTLQRKILETEQLFFRLLNRPAPASGGAHA